MSDKDAIRKMILDFLTELNPGRDLDSLGDGDNLLEADLLTSMDFITMIQTLEEKTGNRVDFTEVDPAALITVAGLMNNFA